MVKFQIELHNHHFTLLQQMAEQDYRDPKQQAAWLIGCAVSASAVVQQEDEAPSSEEDNAHDAH